MRALSARLAGVTAIFCGAVTCAAPHVVRLPRAMEHVDEPPAREEVVAYARRYVDLRWEARPEHVFHGVMEGEAIRIDTPDDQFIRGGWMVGSNVGMPYSWGGFDTPDEFVRKLDADRPAGYVERTRAARGSAYAAAVDCSGLVSRAACPAPERSTS